MSERLEGSALAEWQGHWPVVMAACAGCAIAAVGSYSSSLFFEPLQKAFGWSRVEISSVHLFTAITAILLGPVVGHAIDRFGARRIGILAILALALAFSLIGLTGPSIWMWRGFWVLMALASALVQPMVWSSAIAGYFSAGRGLALAATLCGTSICSVITPPLTVFLIDRLGWRLAFPGLMLCWLAVVFPLVWLFFTSATDQQRLSGQSDRPPRQHLNFFSSFKGDALNPKFLRLLAAGFCIALVVVSLVLTIVPILTANGIPRSTAAGIAALGGLASICGRLTIGALLDRYPGRYVAAIAVCMPIIGSIVLISSPGSVTAAAIAVAVFGLALGAELDILAYLTSRYFKLSSFGLLFGTVGGFVGLAGSIGPVILNRVFDLTNSYAAALWGVVPVCLLSAALFLTMGPYPEHKNT